MTDQQRTTSTAEQITDLLAALHDGITTRDTVPTYRRVHRGKRDALVVEMAVHRTTAPGLLAQLGVISAPAATVPVEVWRWERDPGDQCAAARARARGEDRECSHGRRVLVRTERRSVPGVVSAGAALPGGSPGWDADGALSPMTSRGKPDSAEPIGDGWHTAQEIRDELVALGRELHADGWRPPLTLVEIALADEETGRRIAARLRSLVSRARVAASYDAPIVPLRDVYCPECGGPMRVRADASSAVWCVGTVPVHGPACPEEPDAWPVGWAPCGARWPRGSWVRLLDEATREPA